MDYISPTKNSIIIKKFNYKIFGFLFSAVPSVGLYFAYIINDDTHPAAYPVLFLFVFFGLLIFFSKSNQLLFIEQDALFWFSELGKDKSKGGVPVSQIKEISVTPYRTIERGSLASYQWKLITTNDTVSILPGNLFLGSRNQKKLLDELKKINPAIVFVEKKPVIGTPDKDSW